MKDVLSVILGGGRGTRLYPLTKDRAKPAVPVAGKYRLIDIPISNCLNSGLNKIQILTQFNSASLNRHIARSYRQDFYTRGFVEIIAADQSFEQKDWFEGSADAVRKCFKHFRDPHIKYILILSGDQLYKINLMDLITFHKDKNSQISIACNAVRKNEIAELGIMQIDKNARIKRFVEKPSSGKESEGLGVEVNGEEKFLASMGIYLFNKDVLFELLSGSKKVDFGREIIPDALREQVAFAYIHNGYWKDIGSIKSFYEENLAFTDLEPPLDLFNEEWPFFTRPRYLPLSKIIKTSIENSSIAEGSIIEDSNINHSIIGLRGKIGSGTVIEDSIIMGNDYYDPLTNPLLGIGKNCHIRRAIVDKNVRIGDNVKIINSKKKEEFENEHCVIRNSIIIIPKNTVIPSGTVI